MADVLVNATQWNSLSDADRTKIEAGLRQTGALKADDKVVGDPGVAEFTADTVLEPMWNPIKDICKALCDTAAAAGAAWCTANTAGVGLAACLAAAEAARRVCKDRC